jgi:hypothetical protein
MFKAIVLSSALCLCLAAPARAAGNPETVVPASNPAFRSDVVEVQTTGRSTGGIIVGDMLGGAVAGTAVGGGVVLYNRYVTSNGNWDNWQRNLAIGAGIGLAAGLVFGIVDAASSSNDHVTTTRAVSATEQREVGFAPPLASYGGRF